jgi:hypothetical protein
MMCRTNKFEKYLVDVPFNFFLRSLGRKDESTFMVNLENQWRLYESTI